MPQQNVIYMPAFRTSVVRQNIMTVLRTSIRPMTP